MIHLMGFFLLLFYIIKDQIHSFKPARKALYHQTIPLPQITLNLQGQSTYDSYKSQNNASKHMYKY